MTKTLVALVLIAGGILLVTRVVDTEKPVPARLSPPTSVDQMSEARRLSPSMSARDVCDLIDPWQKCSFSKPNSCRSKDRHESRSRKPLQRVRRRRTRYEKSRQADGARLDTARPYEQGRTGKLLSPLAVLRWVSLRHVRAAPPVAARSPRVARSSSPHSTWQQEERAGVPRGPFDTQELRVHFGLRSDFRHEMVEDDHLRDKDCVPS